MPCWRGAVASRSAAHRERHSCRAAGQAVVRGGYRVTLTGHSLGAGTAALLAMLLHAECAALTNALCLTSPPSPPGANQHCHGETRVAQSNESWQQVAVLKDQC